MHYSDVLRTRLKPIVNRQNDLEQDIQRGRVVIWKAKLDNLIAELLIVVSIDYLGKVWHFCRQNFVLSVRKVKDEDVVQTVVTVKHVCDLSSQHRGTNRSIPRRCDCARLPRDLRLGSPWLN